jgi:hypothetical protein
MDVNERPYFLATKAAQRFTVGDPVRSRARGDSAWLMPFMGPIPDPRTGRTVAYVAATMLVDSLEGVQMARRLPTGSVLTVLNTKGRIIIRTLDEDHWVGRQFPGFSERGQAEQPVSTDTIVPSDIDRIDRSTCATRHGGSTLAFPSPKRLRLRDCSSSTTSSSGFWAACAWCSSPTG